jgi:hypothetical protein
MRRNWLRCSIERKNGTFHRGLSMIPGRRTMFFVTLLPFFCFSSALTGGEETPDFTPEEIRAIAGDILEGRAYQQDLVEADDDREYSLETRQGPARKAGPFFKTIFYLALGIAGLLALIWIGAFLHEKITKPRGSDEAAGTSGQAGPRSDPRLATVEGLAAEGRFDEAAHILLLLAVEHLCAARSVIPAPSLTGRELARKLPANGEERTWFGRLVTAVEVSLFGNRPVSRDVYRSCLDAYRRLAA